MLDPSDVVDEGVFILLIATLKATVMLAGAGVAGRIFKNSSAALRHVVWCVGILSSLIFFVGANRLEQWKVPVLPEPMFSDQRLAVQVSPSQKENQPAIGVVQNESPAAPAQGGDETGSVWWKSLVLLVWLIGVLLVLTRFVVGTLRVRGLVRAATPLTDSSWSGLMCELSRQLKLRRFVRVLRSQQSVMPMTSGVLFPVVLLPQDAVEWSADRLRVVLLHELIHVKRRDLLTQTLAQLVCAIYWFNPLVWFAVRQLRKEQEWACDERVLGTGIKAADYVGHLLEIGRGVYTRNLPMATTTAIVRRSQLEQRLRAILKPAFPGRASTTAMSISALSVVFVLLAGTELVGSERITIGNPLPLAVAAQSPQSKPSAQAKQSPQSAESPRQSPSPSPAPAPPAEPKQTGDDEMAEQVFNSFSAEERNRLMNNGIGPAYIKEMAGAGYRKLTANQLIALFSNSVRADYVSSLDSVGYPNISPAELIALRTNGITADVIKSFQAVKYADFQAGNYIAFRSNGVTPSYLKSMSGVGFDKLTPKQIVDMWVVGITADFIRETRQRGRTNPSPEELIELKKREKP
jgi:beta-lactamase regulating signal transducer with metallopeptidase domain